MPHALSFVMLRRYFSSREQPTINLKEGVGRGFVRGAGLVLNYQYVKFEFGKLIASS